ncbi:MAG: TIGR04283 family arsenosugar biosynthesis glycosyltransferase, partial [Melioribacteraceae bacterium]|nr:TIGR04283 family arsenosugar biosynthesis glycosyltransferase [Melioribacteraceae bacterium]
IIPTLNEEEVIQKVLTDLELQRYNLSYDVEIIICDGGSKDRTVEVCKNFEVVLTNSEKGRGTQLSSGAKISKGSILIFFHADVKIPIDLFSFLDEHFQTDTKVATFRMNLNVTNLLYKLYSFFTRFDSVFTTFGDQGIIVSQNFYNSIGGFKEIPLMEDVDFLIRARKKTKIRKFKKALTVSTRRFDKVGIVKTQLKSFISITSFLIGVDPNKIYKFYYSNKNEKQKSNNHIRKISGRRKSKNSIGLNSK